MKIKMDKMDQTENISNHHHDWTAVYLIIVFYMINYLKPRSNQSKLWKEVKKKNYILSSLK